MKRGEWHPKARELRAEHPDWSYARIGREIGVTASAVNKALNPERAKEYVRRDLARPGRQEQKNAWMREFDRSEAGRGRCDSCGGLKGVGATRHGSRLCKPCRIAVEAAQREARWEVIADLYRDGLPLREIAQRVGLARNGMGPELLLMREAGYDLPHRRRSYAGEPYPEHEVAA